MKHTSWRYRRRRTAQERKEFCEAQRKRVKSRWKKWHEALKNEPTRVTRLTELTIRDSQRPMMVLKLEWSQKGRCRIELNGQMMGLRPMGRTGLGKTLARVLQ